jgi:D-aminoacyl-tRNA deacylase
MRVVLQRVSRAEVRIEGRVSGSIGRGYVLLTAFSSDDTVESLQWMADKILSLRLFPDRSDGHSPTVAGSGAAAAPDDTAREKPSSFSRDISEAEGELLVVSQFTLYGDTRKGRRPSFVGAAPPEIAVPLYESFVGILRARAPDRVATGEFGAMMEVELVNNGPVTLMLERPPART